MYDIMFPGSYSDGSLPAEWDRGGGVRMLSVNVLSWFFEIRLVSNAEEKEALESLWETGPWPCNNVKLLRVHANT